jgi:hypothetical protein
MSDLQHEYQEAAVGDLVDDPVITDPYAVEILGRSEFEGILRARIFTKLFQGGQDSPLNLTVELPDLTACGGSYFDGVSQCSRSEPELFLQDGKRDGALFLGFGAGGAGVFDIEALFHGLHGLEILYRNDGHEPFASPGKDDPFLALRHTIDEIGEAVAGFQSR